MFFFVFSNIGEKWTVVYTQLLQIDLGSIILKVDNNYFLI